MQDPQNLQVWHRAMDLAVRVQRLTRRLDAREVPGMAGQIRRAATSIPANIAEGVGQPSNAVCARHLAVAIGSAFEVETHLLLAARLCSRFTGTEPVLAELREVRRMTHALRQHYLRRASQQAPLPPPT
jgi:four helix bundle protein